MAAPDFDVSQLTVYGGEFKPLACRLNGKEQVTSAQVVMPHVTYNVPLTTESNWKSVVDEAAGKLTLTAQSNYKPFLEIADEVIATGRGGEMTITLGFNEPERLFVSGLRSISAISNDGQALKCTLANGNVGARVYDATSATYAKQVDFGQKVPRETSDALFAAYAGNTEFAFTAYNSDNEVVPYFYRAGIVREFPCKIRGTNAAPIQFIGLELNQKALAYVLKGSKLYFNNLTDNSTTEGPYGIVPSSVTILPTFDNPTFKMYFKKFDEFLIYLEYANISVVSGGTMSVVSYDIGPSPTVTGNMRLLFPGEAGDLLALSYDSVARLTIVDGKYVGTALYSYKPSELNVVAVNSAGYVGADVLVDGSAGEKNFAFGYFEKGVASFRLARVVNGALVITQPTSLHDTATTSVGARVSPNGACGYISPDVQTVFGTARTKSRTVVTYTARSYPPRVVAYHTQPVRPPDYNALTSMTVENHDFPLAYVACDNASGPANIEGWTEMGYPPKGVSYIKTAENSAVVTMDMRGGETNYEFGNKFQVLTSREMGEVCSFPCRPWSGEDCFLFASGKNLVRYQNGGNQTLVEMNDADGDISGIYALTRETAFVATQVNTFYFDGANLQSIANMLGPAAYGFPLSQTSAVLITKLTDSYHWYLVTTNSAAPITIAPDMGVPIMTGSGKYICAMRSDLYAILCYTVATGVLRDYVWPNGSFALPSDTPMFADASVDPEPTFDLIYCQSGTDKAILSMNASLISLNQNPVWEFVAACDRDMTFSWTQALPLEQNKWLLCANLPYFETANLLERVTLPSGEAFQVVFPGYIAKGALRGYRMGFGNDCGISINNRGASVPGTVMAFYSGLSTFKQNVVRIPNPNLNIPTPIPTDVTPSPDPIVNDLPTSNGSDVLPWVAIVAIIIIIGVACLAFFGRHLFRHKD